MSWSIFPISLVIGVIVSGYKYNLEKRRMYMTNNFGGGSKLLRRNRQVEWLLWSNWIPVLLEKNTSKSACDLTVHSFSDSLCRDDSGRLVRTERMRTKDINQRVKMKNYWQVKSLYWNQACLFPLTLVCLVWIGCHLSFWGFSLYYKSYWHSNIIGLCISFVPLQGGVCLAFADEVLCWLYGTVKESKLFFYPCALHLSDTLLVWGCGGVVRGLQISI